MLSVLLIIKFEEGYNNFDEFYSSEISEEFQNPITFSKSLSPLVKLQKIILIFEKEMKIRDGRVKYCMFKLRLELISFLR